MWGREGGGSREGARREWGGGGVKRPPTSFFPVTSTSELAPKNFLTFSFDPFAALV